MLSRLFHSRERAEHKRPGHRFLLHLLQHLHGSVQNQNADRDLDALEGMRDPGDRKKLIQKLRYRKDDAEGGKDHADRCNQRSGEALLFVPDIGRAVDSDRSGRGLRNNGDVHHFIMGDPLLLLYTGILNQCDHGISAAEGEQANLRKGQEENQSNVHFADLTAIYSP